MGVIVIFLLAVLFVAAVWGREAAQKLFKGGMKVAGGLFLLAAIGVIMLAINLQAPSQTEMQQTLSASQNSAYHVPLESGNPNDPGAPLRRPEVAQPPAATGLSPELIAQDNYLTGRSSAANAPAATSPAQFAPAENASTQPPAALPRTGKPNFGFGYRPSNGFVVVTQVYPGSPAADAGITPGMGILGIDGKSVYQLDDVWDAQYRRHQIGDIVVFAVGDGNGTHNVSVRLGSDSEPWGAYVHR